MQVWQMKRLSEVEIIERWNSVAQTGNTLPETLIAFVRLVEDARSGAVDPSPKSASTVLKRCL